MTLSHDMLVEDVLRRWPETVRVLQALALACPGCALAPYCTLADVARSYSLPLPELLERLQQAIDQGAETAGSASA